MFEFLKKRPLPKKILRVRVSGNVVARNLAGEITTLAPGQEVDLAEDTARDLVLAGKAERLGVVKGGTLVTPAVADATPAATFVPPPPLPGFETLPQEFQTARDLDVQLARLRFEATQTYRRRVDYSGNGLDADVVADAMRNLEGAERRAADALAAFSEEKHGRALVAAGDVLLREAAELNATIKELHDLAFSMFAARLAPLELEAQKVRHLYDGSALYQKYKHPVQPFIVPAIKRAGGAGRACYVAGDTDTLAATLLRVREERKRVDGLLVEARAEFAKTQKAVRKAA